MLDMIIVTVCQIFYSLKTTELLAAVFGSVIVTVSCYAPRYICFVQHPKLLNSCSIPVIRAIPLSPAAFAPSFAGLPFPSPRIHIRSPQFTCRRLQLVGFRY